MRDGYFAGGQAMRAASPAVTTGPDISVVAIAAITAALVIVLLWPTSGRWRGLSGHALSRRRDGPTKAGGIAGAPSPARARAWARAPAGAPARARAPAGAPAAARARGAAPARGPATAPAWAAAPAAHAAAAPMPAPLLLDLLAALLESGAPPATALRTTGGVLSAAGDPRAPELLELAVRLEQGGLQPGVLQPGVRRPGAPQHGVLQSQPRPPDVRGQVSPRPRGADAGAADPGHADPRVASPGVSDPRAANLRAANPHAAGDGVRRQASEQSLVALADALGMAVLAGLPPAALVRRTATQERRRQAAAGQRAIRRLEVLLVLPMGLCLLPAFVLLGIAPVVIDLLSGS